MHATPISPFHRLVARCRASWPEWFIPFAGALLAFAGTASLWTALASPQSLALADPLLGLPRRFVVIPFGSLELAAALGFLFTRRRGLCLALAAWLMANWLVYRLGLWSMGWPHPRGCLAWWTDALGCGPFAADLVTGSFAALLLIGSVRMLWLDKRGKLRPPAEPFATFAESFKMACPSCGTHIKFDVQNIGRHLPCPRCKAVVTLRKPDETLKMSCYFCKGHIEFPPHAIGTKMPCPHCNMDITLKEPA